ncbi:MAG: hypothetical protein LBK08_13845 [Treponema sp.]|jgi:hypothetical protein|nr:hypothetical protein [Treponema sp.]
MKTGIIASMFLVAVLFFSCQGGARPNPNMLADRDPISMGSVELELEKILSSSLEKKEAQVFFAPRTDSVYLQFRYQSITYRQYWDRAGRAAFVSALTRYRKDYEDHNLGLAPAKASRAYGTLGGYTEWGQVNISVLMSAKANPRMELGYRFSSGSPYFTVLQRRAEDISGMASSDVTRESLNIRSYFTRAQAEELAVLFDQEYLLSLIGGMNAIRSNTEIPADVYTEAE